ncbi:MAG: YhbY family RNA-binding protein [Candidatus Marinimicrobia bacterium]|nr:YhbY family RNA-binding protein [Candidatus Neomarinimicrobiota bacterium]MBL7110273.1 YhbY family RNA-binding protein [Candidatus Neomarinimicrobiota bacterium]
MEKLSSSQKQYLRGLAHHLSPMIFVGKNGVTDGTIISTIKALDAHELIKAKFNEHKDKKKELSNLISDKTNSEIIGRIGNIVILYKQQPDQDKRNIKLP